MKNITISVDDELYRQARIKAAERSESISSLFRTFLTRLTASPGGESELERLQRESALGSTRVPRRLSGNSETGHQAHVVAN